MTTSAENSPCCCAGKHAATPEAIHNAPGLAAIRYRAGRHSTFTRVFGSMLDVVSTQTDAIARHPSRG